MRGVGGVLPNLVFIKFTPPGVTSSQSRLQGSSMTNGCLIELSTLGLKRFKLTPWLCHGEAMGAVPHNSKGQDLCCTRGRSNDSRGSQ